MALAPGQMFLQYSDDSGNPLASGTVTVYDAGTTDLSTIYSDAAGTTTDNPKTFDSGGRVDFFLGSISYDLVIKNAAGATVDTKDDYTVGGGTVTVVSADDTINFNILADNTEKALTFLEAANEYLNFDTRNSAEKIDIAKAIVFNADLRLGSGRVNATLGGPTASPVSINVAGKSTVYLTGETNNTDNEYTFTGAVHGQVILIRSLLSGDGCVFDTNFTVPAEEAVIAMYDTYAGGLGYGYWSVVGQ